MSLAIRCAVLALAMMLAACAAIALRHPPRIDVVGVRLDRVEGADAYFTVDVTLANEADEEIVVNALQARLAIEDQDVAEATLVNAPVRIGAKATASAELAAHTGMDAVLRAIASAMRRGATIVPPGGRPALHYAIEGSATLAGGARVRFRRSGEIGEPRS